MTPFIGQLMLSNPGSSSHPKGECLASNGGGAIYDSGSAGNGVDSQLHAEMEWAACR
jgi:hypothetical protein